MGDPFTFMKLKKQILVAGIFLIVGYVGSCFAFYVHAGPAGNLAYWVYLRGGNETERDEWSFYYFYYPIYKIHRVVGAGRHNYDRGVTLRDGLYDGDELTNNTTR
jgi:hypothetical protein